MESGLVRKSRYALFLLGFLIHSTALAAGEEGFTSVGGTKVSLIKPAGYVAALSFDGFERASGGSSITVVEIQGPFSQVGAAVTGEELSSGGLEILGKENLKIAGYDGYLLHARQPVDGEDHLKWIAVFGDESETVVVTAIFPESEAAELSETLKRTVTAVQWERGGGIDPLSQASFTIEPPEGLAFAFRFSELLSFTPGGETNLEDPKQPSFTVGPLENPFSTASYEEIAMTFLRSNEKSYTVTRVTESRAITIDGLPGWLIVAEATHATQEVPLGIYLVLLFEERALYMISGVAGLEEFQVYHARFEAATASFRRKSQMEE